MTALALSSFDQLAINRVEIPQSCLDLDDRVRTNPFPWRGQFSPGLIEVFLSAYGARGAVVLDPFAGVGTTLVEAARKHYGCFGTEVNPAAVAMAETVNFIALTAQRRREVIQRARGLVDKVLPAWTGPLFGDPRDEADVPRQIANLIRRLPQSDPSRSTLVNVLIRVCEFESPTADDAKRALNQYSEIVDSLPYSSERCVIVNSDARRLPLEDGSVDLVLTSPPYINVFNYHQNNRTAMELLGWDLLHVARSEFGSNRKHRGNRFLTVIQYCLDMEDMLWELRRVMRRFGRVILVVGRESRVLGVPFHNGSLVAALAERSGFAVTLRQERKFKNRFGQLIYEDLVHLSPMGDPIKRQDEGARQLAVDALSLGESSDLKPEVRESLKAAIVQAPHVHQSPIYVLHRS
jgi:hypothetical protein